MTFDAVRAALTRSRAAGGELVLERADLPPIVHRLGAVVELHTIKTGLPTDGLRDLVRLACEFDDAIDLGLWLIAAVLHGKKRDRVTIASSEQSGDWSLQLVVTDDALARPQPARITVPASAVLRPFEPAALAVDFFVDNGGLSLDQWFERDTLVFEGSAEALIALGRNFVELGLTAIRTSRSYASLDDMVAPAPSSELRILVAEHRDDLVRATSVDGEWEPPPRPKAVEVTAPGLRGVLGERLDQYFALEEGELLDIPADLQSTMLSLPLELTFDARLRRGGVSRFVRIAGTAHDVVALGMWLASARITRTGEPALLVAPSGAAIGSCVEHNSATVAVSPTRVQRRSVADFSADLDSSARDEFPLLAMPRERPEFRTTILFAVEEASAPEGVMDHVVFAGRDVDLLTLGGYLMALGAGQEPGSYELPWITGMHVTVAIVEQTA